MDSIGEKKEKSRFLSFVRSLDQLFFFLALLVVINGFLQSYYLEIFVSYLMILLIIISVPRLDKTPKITAILFFSISTLLYIFYYGEINPVTVQVSSNLGLVALFILVPLLGLPIHYGGYIEPLKKIYEKHLFQSWKVYSFSNLLAYALSPMMNVAAVSLTADMVPKERRDLSTIQALSRGYCFSLPWTPFFASVIFVLSLLSINWLNIAPFTFSYMTTMIIIGIATKVLLEKRTKKTKSEPLPTTTKKHEAMGYGKIIELAVMLILMITSIFFIHELFQLPMTISVSVIALIFPLIWSLYLKMPGEYLLECRIYVQKTLSRIKNEVLVFFSASFFGYVFLDTGLGYLLPTFFNAVTHGNVYGLIIVISSVQLLLTAVGIHPLVVAIVFAGSFAHNGLLDPITITFMILCTWGLALSLSPFGAVTLVLSRIFNKSTFFIGFRLNGVFILVAYVIMVIFAILIELFV